MKSYFVHDNGDRPFLVNVSDDQTEVLIYKENRDDEVDPWSWKAEKSNYTVLVGKYRPLKVWIGTSRKSAMTRFGGGFGAKYNGNTILLQLTKLRYLFIGGYITEFSSSSEIVKYFSPVGNNDVPYPYAVDSGNRYYLLVEDVILDNPPRNKNPYYYYYDNNDLTACQFDGIQEYYIDGDKYMMSYHPSGPRRPENMEIVKGGKKIKLTRGMYLSLMEKFGRKMGFSPLETKIVHDRLI